MFIAEQKKKENIAEYLLYMWQLEDILRAYEFNIDNVQKGLIDTTNHSDERKAEARKWYVNLIQQMRLEGVEEKGHLNSSKELLNQLTLFHKDLLKNANETKYVEVYYKTLPYIQELRAKLENEAMDEIEICFTALYGYLLLKLQKKKISSDTTSAISQISHLMRSLSEKYKSLSSKSN